MDYFFYIYHQFFFFRKSNYGYGLFLIGIDDFEIISILVEKDKEIVIENYFLKYYDFDIKNLQTTWFIPQKNNRG